MAVMTLSSCHTELEQEISDLKSRVSDLEEWVSSLNSSYKALSDLVNSINENDHIKGIEDNGDGTYKITFVSNNAITLRSGANGDKPVIGIKYDEDAGTYYWTIQQGEKSSVQWLYDATGKRMRANSITPRFKVENEVWYYTFTDASYLSETGWSMLTSTSVGADGSSIFKSVQLDINGNYLNVELIDGTVFQLPTQKLFDSLTAACDTANANIAAYKELIESVDSNIFVKAVTKIEEEGVTVGYDIVLESGKTLTIRDGKDGEDYVYLGIQFDVSAWSEFWTYSLTKGGDKNFIYYNGEKLPVEPENATPIFGVTDSAGVAYFTITIGNGSAQMLRDSLGNAVKASPIKFFDEVSADGDTIKLQLISFDGADPKTVNLCRKEEWTPVLYLKDTETGSDSLKVTKGESRTFTAYVDSIPASATDFSYTLTAVALDSAYVTSVATPGIAIEGRTTNQKQGYSHAITFKVNSEAVKDSKTRVAVFLNWDDSHTIMKVAEFTVTEGL